MILTAASVALIGSKAHGLELLRESYGDLVPEFAVLPIAEAVVDWPSVRDQCETLVAGYLSGAVDDDEYDARATRIAAGLTLHELPAIPWPSVSVRTSAIAEDGLTAVTEFDRNGADLVLLDLMLPGLPGTEVCRQIRTTSNVPIIMLTAKDSEVDIVVGLELGADDYVTKPYSSRELLARIRAVLRRKTEPETENDAVLEAGDVRMDVERHTVSVQGKDIAMPLKEFELLELLLRNAGRVLTRGQLIDRVWGADYFGDTKTLDVHIKRIRSRIEKEPAQPTMLVTVRGLGYRFEA